MQVDLTMVELKALGAVLNNHKYMLRAITNDAEISQAVKDTEVAKHKRACEVLRKLRAAYKLERSRRAVNRE